MDMDFLSLWAPIAITIAAGLITVIIAFTDADRQRNPHHWWLIGLLQILACVSIGWSTYERKMEEMRYEARYSMLYRQTTAHLNPMKKARIEVNVIYKSSCGEDQWQNLDADLRFIPNDNQSLYNHFHFIPASKLNVRVGIRARDWHDADIWWDADLLQWPKSWERQPTHTDLIGCFPSLEFFSLKCDSVVIKKMEVDFGINTMTFDSIYFSKRSVDGSLMMTYFETINPNYFH